LNSCLFGVAPEYNSLDIFGHVCFIHLPPTERHKLATQFVQCAFLGYSNVYKGFVCYDSDANKLCISQNVVSLKINISLSFTSHDSPSVLRPNFDDMSSYIECFKSRIVY
jgi:hypothetical protein